ncbi:hypothetical protein K402DRAFT_335351 [Aulographum hederae CBS 113979]|uniref:Uncharacterized protein n=1 Tax=Aulographum hederae CBS 113979 TaxID=1176131 RepID=A0A6G1GWK7_9PEZI|nr:hypothetical protein K402DRAFT_335351 [Aulographum hederae CBS 113979]
MQSASTVRGRGSGRGRPWGGRGRGRGRGSAATSTGSRSTVLSGKVSKTATSAKTGTKTVPRGALKKPRGSRGGKRQEKPTLLDVPSLYAGDVIRDAQGNENKPDQPTFTAKQKGVALKQLVASVPQELKKTAQTDKRYLLDASKAFTGRGSARADGHGGWHIKGMKSSLKHYQLLGAAFFRQRESGLEKPQGGLCADQMGLGKTVMMLANIINGRRLKGESGPKTTLIVASPALLSQWHGEILKHCEPKYVGKILKLYGPNCKIESSDPKQVIEDHDIVLTTYGAVRKSYPKIETPLELQTSKEKSKWYQTYFHTHKGPLHQASFLRVVLDEAQAIKNHKASTSLSCRALVATHRWALSGTPVQNTLQELYPYFKFLRVPHTGSFRIFKHNFVEGGTPEQMDRLMIFLKRFMIRRTHLDTMFGAPLLKLPKATEKVQWLDFNDFERNIYEIVRKRIVARINGFAKRKELDKHYSNMFVMLLRLRQMTGNILMVETCMKDLLEREDLEKLKELAEAERHKKNVPIRQQQIRMLRESLAQVQSKNEAAPTAESLNGQEDTTAGASRSEAGGSSSQFGGNRSEAGSSRHGMHFNFQQYLDNLRNDSKWEELASRTVCARCSDVPTDPWFTSCYHIYCKVCIESLIAEHKRSEREESEEGSPTDEEKLPRCLACSDNIFTHKPCDDSEACKLALTSGDESDLDDPMPNARAKGKEKEKDWIDLSTKDVLPSAKTLAVKAQLLNWFDVKGDKKKPKVIIYTQFINMIRILAKMCQVEKWDCLLYHGSMTFSARDKVIEEFGKSPTKNILIASLKCGGIGLNLTMASKVICIDPWWNDAIEQQAFCRVFRMGQENETHLTRLLVKRTVDENMHDMQQRKKAEIDEIMGENSKHRRKLTVMELLQLFGPVEEDAEGNPFIMVENKDPLINPQADSDDEGMGDEI